MKFVNAIMISCMLAVGVLACSCSDSGNDGPNDDTELSAKENALKSAAENYVDNTVLPTYKGMADAAVELYDLCAEIQRKHAAGLLTTADIEKAGNAWKQSRKNWELSESFLFGPASDHNIDPHIDSWPLDKAAMDDLLKDIRAGKGWNIDNNGGYGLLGFHAIEYVLFELSADENSSHPHSPNYTNEELEYLIAVAKDLRNQCVCLEACWAGNDNISERKQQILADAELDYGENYGWEMKNAGQAGSRFKTFQAVAEEILSGCSDIADEVGNTKIGRPHIGSSDDDKNYIESPYSLNSIEDFVDNIKSIQNAYCGTTNKSVSISAYVSSFNLALDTKLRNAIDNAISAISAIPEPFAKTAGGAQAENAVKVVGTDLVDVIDEVQSAIVAHQ